MQQHLVRTLAVLCQEFSFRASQTFVDEKRTREISQCQTKPVESKNHKITMLLMQDSQDGSNSKTVINY